MDEASPHPGGSTSPPWPNDDDEECNEEANSAMYLGIPEERRAARIFTALLRPSLSCINISRMEKWAATLVGPGI
jgi:hypothetical protein